MSASTEIETKVVDVIRRHLHASDRKIDVWTHFVDDLGADSLALVELTLVFEETFDIEIPDEEAGNIRTVRDAITAVENVSFAAEPGNILGLLGPIGAGTATTISSAPASPSSVSTARASSLPSGLASARIRSYFSRWIISRSSS